MAQASILAALKRKLGIEPQTAAERQEMESYNKAQAAGKAREFAEAEALKRRKAVTWSAVDRNKATRRAVSRMDD